MVESRNITIEVPAPLESVHNAIIGAFEGGSNYWLQDARLTRGFEKPGSKLVWWGHSEVFEQPFEFEVSFDDPKKDEGNGEGRRSITNEDLVRALILMFQKSPRHFADLMSEQDDATTHDVFMQYLVLDDIVYG